MDHYLAIIQTILDRCENDNTSPDIHDMEIIKIGNDSDSLTIKKAYRMMSIRWHPDKNPNTDTTQQMIDVNEAYAI